MNNLNQNRQRGVTLIELMIGMVVGLIVVGGVLTIYIAVLESSGELIKQSRLNSEMSALMNIMANDIRRAGYWELNTDGSLTAGIDTYSTAELNVYSPANNPFAQNGSTALDVRTLDGSWDDSGSAGATGSGSCITYTYDSGDRPRNGSVDLAELYGFKRDANAVWMRTSCAGGGTACTVAAPNNCDQGTWNRVTDENTVTVTVLTFDLAGSSCVNASEPDGVDTDGANGIDDANEYNCYTNAPAGGSGDDTAEIRQVKITLEAELANDSIVKGKLVQTVRVRNNLIRTR